MKLSTIASLFQVSDRFSRSGCTVSLLAPCCPSAYAARSSKSIRSDFTTATNLPLVPEVQFTGGAPPSIMLRANWSSVSRSDWPRTDTALFNTVCYSPYGGNGHFCHSPDLSSSGPDYRTILADALSLSLSGCNYACPLSPCFRLGFQVNQSGFIDPIFI
jgi:hypothetical protein